MQLSDKIKKFSVEQAIDYLNKNPVKNMPKLLDWADTFCAGKFEGQRRAIRKDIGMIFQGGALLDSSTVEENVKLPLDLFTLQSEKEKMERVDFCLQRVRLADANHLYPAELSGGMIKRVAIARAIVLNPRYLFCDEPNSGLDPQTSIVIDNLIHEITREYNITTIINTHDMNSVMEIGEKIVYIHDGRKWWEGTKDVILHADNRELNDFVFASAMAKRAKLAAERPDGIPKKI